MAVLEGHELGHNILECHNKRSSAKTTDYEIHQNLDNPTVVIPIGKDCRIKVKSSTSKTGSLDILNDSGATRSVVREDIIKPETITSSNHTMYALSGAQLKAPLTQK